MKFNLKYWLPRLPPHTVHLKSLPISALLTLTFNGLSGGDFNY